MFIPTSKRKVSTRVKWTLDPLYSEINFIATHALLMKVKGCFTDFGSTIITEGEDLTTSHISLWLDPKSINTGNEKRDHYLKSPAFFDCKNNDLIKFTAISFRRVNFTPNYVILGNLTIKSITCPIKLDVEFIGEMKDPHGNYRIGFYINGKLNRKEWRLLWNDNFLHSGSSLIGDEIKIRGKLQFTCS